MCCGIISSCQLAATSEIVKHCCMAFTQCYSKYLTFAILLVQLVYWQSSRLVTERLLVQHSPGPLQTIFSNLPRVQVNSASFPQWELKGVVALLATHQPMNTRFQLAGHHPPPVNIVALGEIAENLLLMALHGTIVVNPQKPDVFHDYLGVYKFHQANFQEISGRFQEGF